MDKKKTEGRNDYSCTEIERITRMETMLNNIDKTVNGNGNDGVADCVIRLDENFKNMNGTLGDMRKDFADIRTSYSALALSQSEINIEKKTIKEYDDKAHRNVVHRRWLYLTTAGLILAVITLLLKALNVISINI